VARAGRRLPVTTLKESPKRTSLNVQVCNYLSNMQLGNFLDHVVYGEAYEAVLPFNSNRSSDLFALAEA